MPAAAVHSHGYGQFDLTYGGIIPRKDRPDRQSSGCRGFTVDRGSTTERKTRLTAPGA